MPAQACSVSVVVPAFNEAGGLAATLASIRAASGRNSATSSGSACGASASRSVAGPTPSWAAIDEAVPPMTYACVASEKPTLNSLTG